MNDSPIQGDYRVQLEAYAGPLDLLLYLVKRHEIDLHDIPIATLTDQYLHHLEAIQAIAPHMAPGMDVEQAGEFLVMAATLLEIKSRMIMPPPPEGEQGAEGEQGDALAGLSDEAYAASSTSGSGGVDPRFELVRQLLAYKRYKDAAIELELRHDEWMRRYAASPHALDEAIRAQIQEKELDLEDVHVLDLCEAFGRLMDSIGQTTGHAVTYDDTPISLHAADIRDRLAREGPLTLRQIFAGRQTRAEMIGLFLAMLELVRDREVHIMQHESDGDIQIQLTTSSESEKSTTEQTAATAAIAGADPAYDWPDPEAYQAALIRAQRRSARLARLRDGETLPPDLDDDEDEDAAFDLNAPGLTEMLDDME
ncbi:MAG: segregation/condensation protein A [Phycisphaeraceae bacterium]|nr:segregation/condensation protein A [Phycisphaeraceae bacterium]